MAQSHYRRLRGYKYALMRDYVHPQPIPIRPAKNIRTRYFRLSTQGRLVVAEGYAWDGPSGPTIDTPNFIRGSLVHDALYQMMRLSLLATDAWRNPADRLLRQVCLEDGMSAFRAWYVYLGVAWFGGGNAAPRPHPEVVVLSAP